MSEIAGDEDLPEDFFCFRRIHAGRCERQFFRWETEDVYRKTSEFLPYCSHPVCLKLFLKQINVYLLMMLMEIHRPVAELAEAYATRTVRLLDGNLIADSDPYDGSAKTEKASAYSCSLYIVPCGSTALTKPDNTNTNANTTRLMFVSIV